MHRIQVNRYFLLVALGLSAACDDPTALRPAPEQERSLVIGLVLIADSTVQPLFLRTAAFDDRFEGFVRAEVYDNDGARVAIATKDSVPSVEIDDWPPCIWRYGILGHHGAGTCIPLKFSPNFGARYHLLVTAAGRPVAEAMATVPGDFKLITATAPGTPPGTSALEAEWTKSEGAYRYLVALRADEFLCYNVRGCLDGWFAETDTTMLRTAVPAQALAEGKGPWHLDIYAVDRALYEYLTTGSGGGLFPVQPVQNVAGGYGVFGAYTRRSIRVGFP